MSRTNRTPRIKRSPDSVHLRTRFELFRRPKRLTPLTFSNFLKRHRIDRSLSYIISPTFPSLCFAELADLADERLVYHRKKSFFSIHRWTHGESHEGNLWTNSYAMRIERRISRVNAWSAKFNEGDCFLDLSQWRRSSTRLSLRIVRPRNGFRADS